MRYSANHLTQFTLGRRAVLRLMTLGVVGLMTLVGSAPALAASQDGDSFWTTFTPSADTRLIFVSDSEGSDSNSGLTPATPVKSLERGVELLRDGYPDWLLLKRGDTWTQTFPYWSKSGRSEDEMMIVGAYGDGGGRPQIRTGPGTVGIRSQGNTETAHVAFVGLHLEPLQRSEDDSTSGVVWYRRSQNILFEDLMVRGFAVNFNIQSLGGSAPVEDIRLNGCVVVDAWSKQGHSQGLFAKNLNGLTIENCVFASNGFSAEHDDPPTIFNHNMYIQTTNENIVVRSNIIADASSHGIQLRSGGVLEDNLFISNPISMLVGGGDNPVPGGVWVSVRRNMAMYGRGISSTLPRSFGLDGSNLREGVIADNIFYMSEIGYNGNVMTLSDQRSHGLTNLTVERNSVIDWHGTFAVGAPGPDQTYSNISIRNNFFNRDLTANDGNGNFNKSLIRVYQGYGPEVSVSDNQYRYYGMHNRPFEVGGADLTVDEWSSQVEPSGTYTALDTPPAGVGLDRYLAHIGRAGGMEEFVAAARARSRQNSDPAISPGAVYQWASQRLAD